jgi:hypothetical protein
MLGFGARKPLGSSSLEATRVRGKGIVGDVNCLEKVFRASSIFSLLAEAKATKTKIQERLERSFIVLSRRHLQAPGLDTREFIVVSELTTFKDQ